MANAFGDVLACREVRARQYRDQLFAAVTGGQINLAHAVLQDFGHQPKHLIPDLVPVWLSLNFLK